jgi:hypothetical protein
LIFRVLEFGGIASRLRAIVVTRNSQRKFVKKKKKKNRTYPERTPGKHVREKKAAINYLR